MKTDGLNKKKANFHIYIEYYQTHISYNAISPSTNKFKIEYYNTPNRINSSYKSCAHIK